MSAPTTILIVDDNPTNLKLAADVLECEGHPILRAQNAEEAQEILQHTTPELILMDIQMPGMDGLTLTRLLKANPAYHHVPIVALTSFAMKGDEQKARDAGCDGYITKPIDTRKLPIQVADILQRSAATKTTEPVPMTVVLVEDNPIDMKLLSMVLESSGHRVFEKTSAEHAVEEIKGRQPEVILLDLKLPGMDGLALARRLKQDPETQHIPIIAMTAAPEKFSKAEALAAGCDAFIVKPVDTRKLSQQVVSAAAHQNGSPEKE